MAYVVLLIQCSLGDPLFSERNSIKLAQPFCREKKKEGIESCSSPHYFGQFGENEIEEYLKTKKRLTKS